MNKIIQGDALEVLKTFKSSSVNMCMTSPPYWALRDYGVSGQLGLESTFDEYIDKLCNIFDEVKRVLKKDGTCWVNLGDTYSAQRWSDKPSTTGVSAPCSDIVIEKKTNLQDKCLCMIPQRFAVEMCNRGWILRNVIIWHKPKCMPSSIKDRFTVDFEYLYFFVKSKKYWFEQQLEDSLWADKDNRYFTGPTIGEKASKGNYAMKKGGSFREDKMRNKRAVWQIPTSSYSEAHFATYPEELCITPIKAGCPNGGIVLDPFAGAGTTLMTAKKLNRQYIGIELNPEYIEIAEKRIENEVGTLF